MRLIHKAVAAVVRKAGTGTELLTFRHPRAGVQLPKGTVEPDETAVEAVLRELEEESGLRLEGLPRPIGQWRRVLDGRFGERASGRVHLWHLFVLDAPAGLPESWSHAASGSPEEDGLTFAFSWLPVDGRLAGKLDPVFGTAVAQLLRHLADESRSGQQMQD